MNDRGPTLSRPNGKKTRRVHWAIERKKEAAQDKQTERDLSAELKETLSCLKSERACGVWFQNPGPAVCPRSACRCAAAHAVLLTRSTKAFVRDGSTSQWTSSARLHRVIEEDCQSQEGEGWVSNGALALEVHAVPLFYSVRLLRMWVAFEDDDSVVLEGRTGSC
ncbi:unnamed protein product [Lampetra planeri]